MAHLLYVGIQADYVAGSGTYVKGDHIYSSLVGTTQVFDSSLPAEDKVTSV